MTNRIAKSAAIFAAIIAIAASPVEAAPNQFRAAPQTTNIGMLLPAIQQAREAASRPSLPGTQIFVAKGGPVADTCTESTPGNPEACDIDELTARCDDAGGGMVTLPGGGVECDTSSWDNE